MGVTGEPLQSEVLQLAEKIVGVIREHTSNTLTARAAIQAADAVIASSLLTEEPPVSAPVPEQSSAMRE